MLLSGILFQRVFGWEHVLGENNLINSTLKDFELNNPDWEFKSAKIFIRKKISGFNDEKNTEKNLAKMSRAGFNYNMSKKMLGLD